MLIVVFCIENVFTKKSKKNIFKIIVGNNVLDNCSCKGTKRKFKK